MCLGLRLPVAAPRCCGVPTAPARLPAVVRVLQAAELAGPRWHTSTLSPTCEMPSTCAAPPVALCWVEAVVGVALATAVAVCSPEAEE